MFMLKTDLDEPYVPFVTSRHSSSPVRELRQRDSRPSGTRRFIGRALIRAGLTVAGLDTTNR